MQFKIEIVKKRLRKYALRVVKCQNIGFVLCITCSLSHGHLIKQNTCIAAIYLNENHKSQKTITRQTNEHTGVLPTATSYLVAAALTSTLLYPTAMLLKALPPALLNAENSVSPQSSVN